MHTNYFKIVKLLRSFKIIITAPTCFGLHKPSSESYSLCLAKVTYKAAYAATVPINNDMQPISTL